jgi:hypothetical protein
MSDVETKREAIAAQRKANLAKGRATAAANRAARALQPTATAAPPPPADTPVAELDGLTVNECAFGCLPERCVISRTAHCCHPTKGGLQATEQRDPEVIARYQRARRLLAHQAADKKG